MSRLPERGHTIDADLFHRFPCWFEIVTGVKFLGIFCQHLANGPGDGQSIISIHVDFTYTVLDAPLDFFYRNSPGLPNFPAELIYDVLQMLRDGRATMHHQVGIRKSLVNLFDTIHVQHITIGLAGKFISAVTGSKGDGDCINTCGCDELF